MATIQSKDENLKNRINLRLKRSTKELLERAAGFEGKTLSNFILTSALVHAEKTVYEHEVMSLNAKESEIFFNALATPPHFSRKLTAALKEHDNRVINK